MSFSFLEERLPTLILLLVTIVVGALLLWGREDSSSELLSPTPTTSLERAPQRSEDRVAASSAPENAPTVSITPAPSIKEPAAARRLSVTVLDAEGQGLEGVKVQGIDENLHVETTSTDEAGRAELNHPNSGWIVARPPAMPPLTARVRPDEDDYVLQLEVGVEIHGQVLVDGRPASHAHLSAMIASPRRSALPDRVARCVQGMPSTRTFAVTTDANGRFRVRGLRYGDEVWVDLPLGTELAAGTSNPTYNKEYVGPLADPVTHVLIRAVTTRVLEGHCVDGDGKPLSGVEIQVVGESPHGSRQQSERAQSDAAGLFRVPMPKLWDAGLPAIVEARWGGLTLTQSTPDQPWSGKAFLADFVFPRGLLLTVTVEDEEGQPIPNARVGLSTRGDLVRTTDADGKATLGLAPGSLATLDVAAFGYEFQRIEVRPTDEHALLEVHMTRASRVSILVVDDQGRPVPRHRCGLAGSPAVLRDPSAWKSPAFLSSLPGTGGWKLGSNAHVSGITDARGRFRVYDLADDVVLQAVAYGVGARILARDAPRVIPRRSSIDFTVRLPAGMTTLRGIVVDEKGSPVADVQVRAGTAKHAEDLGRCVTDSQGRFSFHEICADGAFLHAYRVGYLAVDRFIEPLSSHMEPERLVLRQARECEVQVRRANGELAAESWLDFARHPKRDGPFIRRRGDGTFKILNLDDRPLKLLVRDMGAPTVPVTIDPVREPLKVVHLPPKGRVRVSWTPNPRSKTIIMYRSDAISHAHIAWADRRSSTEILLPEGRYEIGRARKIEGHYEFVGKTQVVDLHAGSDIRLWID